RPNAEVNDHWMCDHGRLHYAFVNDPERLVAPRAAGKPAPYPAAIQRAADLLRGAKEHGVLAVASPFMTNEELFALKGVCDALDAGERYFLKPMGEGDKLLVHPEKCPNAFGARLAGFLEAPAEWPAREFGALLYVEPREGASLPEPVAARAARRVVFSFRERQADACFPLTTWIEKDGTVVSAGDRVQRYVKGITVDRALLTERVVLERLRALLDPAFRHAETAAQAFDRLAAECPAFHGLSWRSVGALGTRLAREGVPA
ncbi:MAG: hypothetical protein ACREID_06040, partial [Planctomycetota bacterium]